VQTWGPGGYGPWSSSLTFTIGTTTLRRPMGVVTQARPIFTWDEVHGATWYQISLHLDGAPHWSEWTQETRWSPEWDMTDYTGTYEWWVQPWAPPSEYFAWSSRLTFTIGDAPDATRLRSPSGTVAIGDVNFSWDAVEHAIWYRFYLKKDGVLHDDAWLEGETGRTLELPAGDYEYWVRTLTFDDHGTWSDALSFTVSASVSGTVTGDVQEGVTVTLSGDANASTTTVAGGSYSFWVADGDYKVTPSLTGYTFINECEEATVIGADLANVDFASSPVAETVVPERRQGGR